MKPQWVQCCNRSHMANVSQSSGNFRNIAWRTAFWTGKRCDVTAVKLVFSNTYLNASGEQPGLNQVNINASVEYNGSYVPIFFNGSRTGVMMPGATIVSDEAVITIPANTRFWTRQNPITLNATEKYATGYTTRSDFGEGFSTSSPTTQIDAVGALTGEQQSAIYGPVAVLGKVLTKEDLNSVVIIGSSSAFGTGETFATLPSPGDRGYLSRAVTNNVGQVVIAAASQTLAQWISANALRSEMIRIINPSHIIQQLGSNDIAAGDTFATVTANLRSMWMQLGRDGAKIIQSTFTPRTTSTDAWATTQNQTPAATEAVRVQVNNYIRSLPYPLWGVLDAADNAETSRDSGIWPVTDGAWTTDGIHTTRHDAVYAGLLLQSESLEGILTNKKSTNYKLGGIDWTVFSAMPRAQQSAYLKSFQALGGVVVSASAHGLYTTNSGKVKIDTAATRRGG